MAVGVLSTYDQAYFLSEEKERGAKKDHLIAGQRIREVGCVRGLRSVD